MNNSKVEQLAWLKLNRLNSISNEVLSTIRLIYFLYKYFNFNMEIISK